MIQGITLGHLNWPTLIYCIVGWIGVSCGLQNRNFSVQNFFFNYLWMNWWCHTDFWSRIKCKLKLNQDATPLIKRFLNTVPSTQTATKAKFDFIWPLPLTHHLRGSSWALTEQCVGSQCAPQWHLVAGGVEPAPFCDFEAHCLFKACCPPEFRVRS